MRDDLLVDGRPHLLGDAELLEGAALEAGQPLLGERRQAVAVAHHQGDARVLGLREYGRRNQIQGDPFGRGRLFVDIKLKVLP